MSENDIIAEYIKEKHPALIQSADYAIYKMAYILRKWTESFADVVRNIDWKKLNEFAEEVKDGKK